MGKSTLMNRLIGQKIAITSNKPQTTRNRIQTVYTDMEKGQIVFLDTPGIHKAKAITNPLRQQTEHSIYCCPQPTQYAQYHKQHDACYYHQYEC